MKRCGKGKSCKPHSHRFIDQQKGVGEGEMEIQTKATDTERVRQEREDGEKKPGGEKDEMKER